MQNQEEVVGLVLLMGLKEATWFLSACKSTSVARDSASPVTILKMSGLQNRVHQWRNVLGHLFPTPCFCSFPTITLSKAWTF